MGKVIAVLEREALTDLLAVGYVDREAGRAAFHPMSENLYLVFERSILRLASVDQYSRLRIEVASAIESSFDVDVDDEFATASLFELLLGGGYEAMRVTRLRCFLDATSDPDAGLARGAEICLEDRDVLFFDPLNTSGIRIGSAAERDRWLREYGAAPGHREFTWTRPGGAA